MVSLTGPPPLLDLLVAVSGNPIQAKNLSVGAKVSHFGIAEPTNLIISRYLLSSFGRLMHCDLIHPSPPECTDSSLATDRAIRTRRSVSVTPRSFSRGIRLEFHYLLLNIFQMIKTVRATIIIPSRPMLLGTIYSNIGRSLKGYLARFHDDMSKADPAWPSNLSRRSSDIPKQRGSLGHHTPSGATCMLDGIDG